VPGLFDIGADTIGLLVPGGSIAVKVADRDSGKVVGYLVGRTPGQFHGKFRKGRRLRLAICIVAGIASQAHRIVGALLIEAIDESIAIVVNTIVANLHGLGESISGHQNQRRSKNK